MFGYKEQKKPTKKQIELQKRAGKFFDDYRDLVIKHLMEHRVIRQQLPNGFLYTMEIVDISQDPEYLGKVRTAKAQAEQMSQRP